MGKIDSALRAGTIIRGPVSTYTIIKFLGQGGFGITYLAETEVMYGNIPVKVQVALKEHFLKDYCERHSDTMSVNYSRPVAETVENSLKAFIREAQRLKELGVNHPNIVTINEVFKANNTAYYVMEYLSGGSLADRVKQAGAMSPDMMLHLLTPVIEAVAAMHRESIAHYDIKPQNIMFAAGHDGSERAVLIDFGLAKHYDSSGNATSSILSAGYSPGYAPIEQYKGITTFSPGCDVYALGATMYFVLTGHAPDDADQIELDAVSDEIRKISTTLAPVIVKALALKAANRYADAGAMLKDIAPTQSAPKQRRPTVKSSTATVPKASSNKSNPSAKTPPATSKTVKSTETVRHGNQKSKVFGHPAIIPIFLVAIIITMIVVIRYAGDSSHSSYEANDTTAAPLPTTVLTGYHTDCRNLDLYTLRNGEACFFTIDEWQALTPEQQKEFDRQGVVIKKDGQLFSLALRHSDQAMTWDDAMALYGDRLPTKEQAEAMASQYEAVNAAIIAFGGDKNPRDWYWSGTESNSSYAWGVCMYNGTVNLGYGKAKPTRVRAVAPVPGSSAR